MLRYRKKEKESAVRFFLVLIAVPALALTVHLCRLNIDFLSRAGESAAMLSAVAAMPDSWADLVRERFRGELYADTPLPPEITPEQGQPVWPPPQVLEPEDSVPEAPGTADNSNTPGQNPVKRIPKISEEYAAPVISENFAGSENGFFVKWRNGYIKNDTKHSDEDVLAILERPWATEFDDLSEPQVLIVHTHTTESYEKYDHELYDTRNTWRSTDNNNNMAAVGNAMREVLEENGIAVLHDTTQHDYPSYNGSYERSAETIRRYLEEYPSIKIVLDLHRDAMQREDAIVKPVAEIDGQKAAQIMIIATCEDGSMGVPQWRENLRFAATFQDYMEQYYPDLTKPVFFCYRKYNMDLTTGSLLLEFGSNANTLEEALYSARMAGQALSNLILDLID